ncbi:MAG: hypothetical protein WCK51_15985 [Armatimonadota bacterium]
MSGTVLYTWHPAGSGMPLMSCTGISNLLSPELLEMEASEPPHLPVDV